MGRMKTEQSIPGTRELHRRTAHSCVGDGYHCTGARACAGYLLRHDGYQLN
jgi:hypothetical protein